MIFRHFLTNNNESNAFVVGCEQTRIAMLVDAGEFNGAMNEFVREHDLVLSHVFITHDHFDHTDGLREVMRRFKPQIISGSGHAGGFATLKGSHGDTLQIGEISGRILAVPGHTPDSICLVLPGMVFTGDALFAGSIGGTNSPLLSEQLKDGIRQHIFSLPLDYEIHTGHGPSSTVAIESRYNPFFQ